MTPVALAVQIVAAFVSRNRTEPNQLPELILDVHKALAAVIAAPASEDEGAAQRPSSVQIRRSIRDDVLISFEDGRPYKMLKRHLATKGLTPETYRAKWGLPADYPMTAPAYSAVRSQTARTNGLGRLTRGRSKQAHASPVA